MGWTTPIDWENGELVTEAMLDAQIKDNMNYVHSGKPLVAILRNNGADYTTTSTSFVDIDSTYLSITLPVTTGRIGMALVGTFYGNDNQSVVQLDFAIDGTRLSGRTDGYAQELVKVDSNLLNIVAFKTGLATGSYIIRPQWKVPNALYAAKVFADNNRPISFFAWEV